VQSPCSCSRRARVAPGRRFDNQVLRTEDRVTFVDGVLATAVLVGLVLNATVGWWWAGPAAGYVLVYYGGREARRAFRPRHLPPRASQRHGRTTAQLTVPRDRPQVNRGYV